ncbi:MAG: copper-binding protein [Candidatus Rokubacteria bacterium]|nr:copper-binding protein [Candidatus Rokubacteria bacterium]
MLARPASNLLLVRHEAIEALGMSRMEMMAVLGDAPLLDAADPKPGDRVRLALRRKDDEIVLIRIEKLR